MGKTGDVDKSEREGVRLTDKDVDEKENGAGLEIVQLGSHFSSSILKRSSACST